MAKRGIVGTAVGAFAFIGLSYGVYFSHTAGLFRSIEETKPGQCSAISGFTGPEDIAIDHERGLAYVTIADRHAVEREKGTPKGNIALLNLREDSPKPVFLNPDTPDAFFPHGLDIHIDRDGTRRLFIVNHGADGQTHSIDVYVIQGGNRLTLETRFRDPLISSPNDVAAVSPTAFFVSIDSGAKTTLGKVFERYAMLPWGNVTHYKDGNAEIVVEGLIYANGVTYDSHHEMVLVAESIGRRVTAYKNRPDKGGWQKIWAKDVPMSLDNMSLTQNGDVLVTGHPKILEFVAHAKDTTLPSSSEVVRLSINDEGEPQWRTLYLDRGEEISAASIAALYEGRLFIGAVFDDHMMMCDMEN